MLLLRCFGTGAKAVSNGNAQLSLSDPGLEKGKLQLYDAPTKLVSSSYPHVT